MLYDNYPDITTEEREALIAGLRKVVDYDGRYVEVGEVLDGLVADRMRKP